VLRLRSALLLVAVIGTTVVPVPAAKASTGPLPDGLTTVATGSQLLGETVLPYVRERDFRGTEDGWTAMFTVTGPAATVYDAYAMQLRKRGIGIAWSDEACQSEGEANVRCTALEESGPARGEIDLRVCSQCSPATALMLLSGWNVGEPVDTPPGAPPATREPAFEVQIKPKELRSARLPVVGQRLAPGIQMRVVNGSTPIATGDIAGCASGSVNAAFKVTGNAMSVYRRYVAQLTRPDPVKAVKGRLNGHPAAEAGNVYGTVRMAERDNGPLITVARCNDD
jgi:hypothetical protein